MRRSGKVRESSPQKVRESQGILSGHVSGNPESMHIHFNSNFTGVLDQYP